MILLHDIEAMCNSARWCHKAEIFWLRISTLQDIIKAAGLKNDTTSVCSIATMSKCNHFFKHSGAFCELKWRINIFRAKSEGILACLNKLMNSKNQTMV